MFMRVALCGKLAVIMGLVFLILGITAIVSEVRLGVFQLQQSFGVVTFLAGIGLLFFYTLKYLEGRAGNATSCQLKR